MVAEWVGGVSGLKPVSPMAAGAPNSLSVPGVIEKTIRAGQFLALLENGQKVRVRSSADLEVGQKVTVLISPLPEGTAIQAPQTDRPLDGVEGTFLTALIPLGFGAKGSSVQLEIFTEKVNKDPGAEKSRASYLVLTSDFGDGDRLQWSLYLKGKSLSLQVYADEGTAQRHNLEWLLPEVEKKLKKLGFVLSAPTVRLAKPFKLPKGFRLNVRA
ncbi:MAG: hypothetical protein ACREL1_08810 [bacterium]